ncbi:MAG: carboxypeptidase-like regulatory domain-containing protein [Prevotellaceae bacterium]|jgi:uncharacterized protein YfaS (alpha-2-macroglobulin family)|nr:carboxypeptidase-like regulatory domain-containing protein [Prevotellaceae bacterium]
MKKILVCMIITFGCAVFAKAQTNNEKWIEIDTLFADGLYKTAVEKLNIIYGQSFANGDDVQFMKSIIYRLTCQQYTEENVTVATVNALRNDLQKTQSDVAQALINSLLGKAFWDYYSQNRWRFQNRTDVNDDVENSDITTWSLNRIFDECIGAYKRSLENSDALGKIKIDYINDILIENKATREYRPTLYDFVAHQAITTLGNSEIRITKPKDAFLPNDENLFTCDAQKFAEISIAGSDSVSSLLLVLQTLQQLTEFHLQRNDILAVGDLTLKRFDFLKANSTLENRNVLIMANLQKFIENTEKNDIWFEAMYRLAQMHCDSGDRVKAIELCNDALKQENINERQKQVFKKYIEYIKCPQLGMTVEDIGIPRKPVKILVNCKDLSSVYFRIYKVPVENRFKMLENISYLDDDKENFIAKYALLADEWFENVPQTNDYKPHTTEIVYGKPLEQGIFLIVASSSPDFFNAGKKIIACAVFQLSSIAYTYKIISDKYNEIYIVNSETGKPIKGAKVNIYMYRDDDIIELSNEFISDENGIIKGNIKSEYSDFISIIENDNYFLTENSGLNTMLRYNPFYFHNTYITKFFLDRAIYRPGQTVYFKGILMDYNDNHRTIIVNRKETVILKDVNRQEIAKLDVVSNEYGTFSGSFVLPQSVLGGMFMIESDKSVIYFNVEEYKRPAFEVTINPVEKNYKFNETVSLSGIAKSYAGYSIDNAKVSYSIIRSLEFPYRWWWMPISNESRTIDNGETTTDENGKFEITFFADGSGLKNDMQIASYNITVDITDNNGETHSDQYNLRISKKPLIIEADIPETANIDDSLIFDLATKNLNEQFTQSDITVKIYKLKQPEHPLRKRLWEKPDKPLLSYGEYKKLFPNDAYGDEDKIENFEEIGLVKTVSFNTDKTKKINLDELKKHGNASYRFDITAKSGENITTEIKTYIQLQSNNILADMKNWIRKGKQTEKEVEFFVGGMSGSTYVHYDVAYRNDLIESKNIIVGKTPKSIKIAIPKTKNNEEFAVSFVSIYENRIYTSDHVINPREDKNDLDISLVTFRDKLQPGEKEQWKLRIKSAGSEKATAEMLASLYDASLDAFVMHDWNKDFAKSSVLDYSHTNWKTSIISSVNSINLYRIYANKRLNLDKDYDFLANVAYFRNQHINTVTGSIRGVVIDENNMPLEYVSVSLKNKPVTGTVTDVNGEFGIDAEIGDVLVFSYIGYNSREIAVQNSTVNVVLTSDASVIMDYDDDVFMEYSDASIFEESVVSAYEDVSKSLAGSVRGIALEKNAMPSATFFDKKETDKNVTVTGIRTNFNETAFFYPELRTDSNGEIIIDFVIPESLTKWKLLGLAHTKNLETGKVTAYTVTQKEVAVSANAPRFFREGDSMEFSAKINNITENKIKGKAQLLLFDAFTMQPVNIITNETEQNFSVNTNQSVAVKWNLKIPSNIEAITYRVLAITDKHSDGEEKAVPVLPNSMLVSESLPFTIRGNESKDFNFDRIISNTSTTLKNYNYTIEFTSNPVWYAVQAMPYIMEYPYECSEQVFTRFYANSLSSKIVDKFPQIKRTFDIWKMTNSQELLSNLEKNQELKNILLEETPWLRNAKDENENKKRIALLFDLNKMQSAQQSALDKLKKNQMGSGAFPWFGGMCESRYITQHIAIGLEHLKKLNAIGDRYKTDVNDISAATAKYLDAKMLEDYNNLLKSEIDLTKYETSDILLHYLYLRSFTGIGNLTKEQKAAFDYFLNQIDKNPFDREIYQQALIALAAYRLGKPELAQKIINSLRERAQTSEEMGMYWAKNQRGYFWHQAPVETQALLIEAFSEIGDNKKEVEEMKIWLLRNRQTNDWGTTKSTAEACYALLMQGENYLNGNAVLQVKLNSEPLEELKKEDFKNAKAGTGYVKTSWHGDEIKTDFGKINVTNPNSAIAWGAAYWQYFENLDKITSAQTGLSIVRQYFIVENTDAGMKLNPVNEKQSVKIGDRVKARIELRADRDYEYVHLKDMRASGFEPVNVISQSKYQDGIWYYENTRDAATNFFIYWLPKGTYVFEYDLRANNAGEFSTGIATFQCMYAPEFSSHSSGERIVIKDAGDL